MVFRGGENHRNRFDLRDRHDAGLGRGIDDVADIDLAQADDAGDRRPDGGVVELGLGVGNGRNVGRDLRRHLLNGGTLGIQLLPGRELAELGVSLQIQVGIGQIGLVLFLLGLGLIERSLIWSGIDFSEQVALIDLLTFLEGDFVDLAIDTATHEDGVKTLNRSKPGQIDRKIGFLDWRGGDAHGIACRFLRIARRGCLVRAPNAQPAIIAQPDDGQDQ